MVGIDLLVCYHIYYTCNRIEVLTKIMDSWNNQIKFVSKSKSYGSRKTMLSIIIGHHVMVKETMTQLEYIFSPMILAILVSNSFAICMLLMKLVAVGVFIFIEIDIRFKTHPFQDPFSKVVFHCMVVFSQTFMYCFIGNLVLVKVSLWST